MPKSVVTEQEIEIASQLSAKREFAASLALYQEMLTRTDDDLIRLRLLYGIVTCAIWLNREGLLNKTVEELKQLPDHEISSAFVVLAQARAADNFGRPQEALDLINENLKSDVLRREDFLNWKYQHLFFKGRYLGELGQYDKALDALDAAHGIFPDGEYETDILVEQSNCLFALNRFSEAYNTASKVLTRCDDDMATLAMQYMAESRLWQREPMAALELYASIQKRLPCPLVQEERIEKGIENAMTQLEMNQPPGKPS